MTKPDHPANPLRGLTSQLSIAFTTSHVLDPRQRAEVVALLSRLLLQVATALNDGEVGDEHS